jgi:methylated-DNA-[protein]-cysteine S-methyltransferase
MTQYYTYMESPVGRLRLAGDGSAITELTVVGDPAASTPSEDWVETSEPFRDVMVQLRDYFAGHLREFDVSVEPEGTPFEEAVWRRLREIPYGTVISRDELARRLGTPGGAGALRVANPVSILVPCHRVLDGDGLDSPVADLLRRLEQSHADETTLS